MVISTYTPVLPFGAGNAALIPAAAGFRGAESSSFASALEKARENREYPGIDETGGHSSPLRKACLDFESYFLQIMFREMRKTSFAGENGVSQNDRASEIFRDMLDGEYANAFAKTGGIGLAEMMYKAIPDSP